VGWEFGILEGSKKCQEFAFDDVGVGARVWHIEFEGGVGDVEDAAFTAWVEESGFRYLPWRVLRSREGTNDVEIGSTRGAVWGGVVIADVPRRDDSESKAGRGRGQGRIGVREGVGFVGEGKLGNPVEVVEEGREGRRRGAWWERWGGKRHWCYLNGGGGGGESKVARECVA
jgi:hypothetical protein